MKKKTGQDERGFTLVELLIVTGMLGFVMTAMYSLYISHQRSAYTSDETVEVQQNLRIAMDSISRDLRNAGFLLQTNSTGTTPISAGTGTTTIFISSGCPSGIITRITPSPLTSYTATASPNTFTVDNDGSVSAFKDQDYVRIIRPVDKTQPGGTNRIYQVLGSPVGSSITLNIVSGTQPNNVIFNKGDVICRLTYSTTPAPPNTIRYYLDNTGTCPVQQQCLMRADETGTNNVVAQNMANNGLQFQYLLDQYPLPNETMAPTDTELKVIRAVRVTLTGTTATTVGLSGNVPKTRQMETLIQIRNR